MTLHLWILAGLAGFAVLFGALLCALSSKCEVREK